MTFPEQRVPRTITPRDAPAIEGNGELVFPWAHRELKTRVRAALDEDRAFHDVTTIATVVTDRHIRGRLVAREAGVVAGVPLAIEAFRQLDPKVSLRIDVEDGGRVQRGTPILFISGHARPVLAAERVALNYMLRLSGIASLTARYVDAVRGTRAKILDTRKTTPGWRALEKYAVRAGGGTNHRMDLATSVLIKDNHLAALEGNIELGVRRARDIAVPGTKVEVECETLEQVAASIAAGADIIMLDNMPPDMMQEAVQLAAGRVTLEASGGVTLENVRAIAETGVDWISIGALTHSARALNLAVDFDPL
ncbi:MAG TPA: carboxylating nicotinate-nucleotide diphosphorylase [Gemmatimonadaceae bacterium]|nr:carboxylating nicotinate-nucleotide diphosphorylase [Gemmatimonadaceae bacterium]